MHYQYKENIINYEIEGHGKPIIILHGLGCDLNMMKACLEPIFKKKSDYKRIYIDLPGMGKSAGNIEDASSDAILNILLHFIESNINENYLLIGESYGGYLARGILSQQIRKIDGLMLLCPVVVPESEKRKLPDDKLEFNDSAFLETLSDEEKAAFCEYAVIANEDTYKRYISEILPGIKMSDEKFLSELESNYAFSFDVDQIIRAADFDKPTLFLCGRQDNCVGYKDLEKLLDDYSRASFAVLDSAGHNLQIEQNSLFQELVRNWLERTEGLNR